MTKWIEWVLRNRIFVSVVMALVTLLALIPLSNAVIGTSLGQLFFGNSPAFQRYLEISEKFGNDEVLVIALRDVDALNPAVLDQLDAAEEAILNVPEVARVQSVANAQWVRVEDEMVLRISSYAEEIREESTPRDTLLDALLDDGQIGGILFSSNQLHTAVIVELRPNPNRPAEDSPKTVQAIRDAITATGLDESRIHVAGLQATLSEIMRQSKLSLTRIFPVSTIALLGVVFLLFGRLWPALASGLNALLAVIWSMGFATSIDPQVNIMLSVVPAVVAVVSFADVIHLCSAYLIELQKGGDKTEAIVRSCSDVGRACLLTSVTTFLGFIGMSFVPTPAFQQLGVVLGFGTGVALLIAVTMVPILLYYLPTPSPDRKNRLESLTSWILEGCNRISTGRPTTVIGLFALVTGVLIFGVQQLHIETSFRDRLAPENQSAIDEAFFEEHFTTSHLLPVVLSTGKEDGVLDPEFYSKLVTFTETAEGWSSIEKATSLVDLIETIHEPFTADDPDPSPYPDTREALAQYLVLFEMEGGENLERIIDFKRESVCVLFRMEEGKMRETAVVAERLVEMGRELFGESVSIEPTGQLVLTGDWLDEILDGQKSGLLFTSIAITIVMAIGTRSLLLGLLSMIPNLFPLLFLGGLLGLTQDFTDSDHLIIALLALSIGVDDTIHFIMRYRTEARRQETREAAISETFAFAGRGILNTTIALGLGFSPFLMSDYLSTHIFGSLLPLVFVVAFLADALLLPALAARGWLPIPGETWRRVS